MTGLKFGSAATSLAAVSLATVSVAVAQSQVFWPQESQVVLHRAP
jgi:hypothetical protein